MVLLVAKFSKLYSKLENNLHHHTTQPSDDDVAVLTASLQGFFANVSGAFNNKLSSKTSTATSLSCLRGFFDTIPATNKAFAKLVMAIDHPVSKWESDSVDRYLNYTLTLLDLLNSITSSLSRLGLARLSISLGLHLKEEKSPSAALKHLKPIEPLFLLPNSKSKAGFGGVDVGEEMTCCSSKEEAIRRAISAMERACKWVCWVVVSSLSGGEFSELNESVTRLVAEIENGNSGEDEARDLRVRLEAFEKGLDGFGSEIDRLFNELLGKRNQLLDGFRTQSIK